MVRGVLPNADGTQRPLRLDYVLDRRARLPVRVRTGGGHQAFPGPMASHLRRRGIAVTIGRGHRTALQFPLLHHARRSRLAPRTRCTASLCGTSGRPTHRRRTPGRSAERLAGTAQAKTQQERPTIVGVRPLEKSQGRLADDKDGAQYQGPINESFQVFVQEIGRIRNDADVAFLHTSQAAETRDTPAGRPRGGSSPDRQMPGHYYLSGLH